MLFQIALPWICMATRVEFVWFSNASSNWLPEQMQIRTHCICLLFTTMCFEIALIFPALHVTTATLDSFVQVTWNITWRGSRQKRKYSVCLIPVLLERGDVELSCGSFFNSNWSCNYIFTRFPPPAAPSPDIDLCWDFKWCQMKHTTKEKSCTTWQDMFGHRLPQNRCSMMQNFAVFWRKFAYGCDLIIWKWWNT